MQLFFFLGGGGQFLVPGMSWVFNPGGGVTPHMKGVGMLVGNFELIP